MEITETNKILRKIVTFRQSFLIKKDTVDEWHKILKDYDYKDVDEKLDEYFRESKNFGQYPDPYYLTKYLVKSNEKFSMSNITIKCSLCGKTVSQAKYDEHYDMCSSIDYVCRMYEQHFDKKLNADDLWELPKEKFDNMYWRFCDNLYNKLPEGLEKKCLENAIRSHKGLPLKYTFEELSKEI